MKKKSIIALSGLLALAVCAALLGASCSKERKLNKSRPINVKDVYISGEWKDFIKIEDGSYVLEDTSAGPQIGVKITLIKPYTGAEENPARSLLLNPTNKAGTNIGREFLIEPRDKFNDLVKSSAGTSAVITFRTLIGKDDKWFPLIAGFDAVTRPRSSSESAASASAPSQPAPNLRVVAVPPFTGIGNVPDELITGITTVVPNYLRGNPGIRTAMDINQINALRLNFQADDWQNPAKFTEIGKALNVDTIAVGTITVGERLAFQQTYIVTLRLVDTATLAEVAFYTTDAVSRNTYTPYLEVQVKRMKIE